jgi:hypothetical protein
MEKFNKKSFEIFKTEKNPELAHILYKNESNEKLPYALEKGNLSNTETPMKPNFIEHIVSVETNKPKTSHNVIKLKDIPEEANKYQETILSERIINVPDLPDYTAAYRKLTTERNKPWKLNPSDIADFYLLEPFISRVGESQTHIEDTLNMALLNARDRVRDIGKRLLVAMTYEQLDEYDRFTTIIPSKVPDALKEKVNTFYEEQRPLGMLSNKENTLAHRMNYYLSAFKNKMDDHTASRRGTLDVFDDTDMFGTALEILENQQTGRWKVMASAMRALHDPSIPIDGFIDNFIPPQVSDEDRQKTIDQIEGKRGTFLVDRLINYVHNTGLMSARVTNNFPQSASLLLAHGMPQHEGYLFYHSSFAHSGDTLATQLRRSVSQNEDRDIVEDLTEVVKNANLPREFEYGLLLEFPHEQLQAAIKAKRAGENLSPGRVYNLLQRVSHHDGKSRGRLAVAA